MTDDLKKLLELARTVKMTSSQKEEQRQSFAYGNAAFENERVTREMVAEEAARLEDD